MTPIFSIFTLAIKFNCLFLTIFQRFHLFVSFIFDNEMCSNDSAMVTEQCTNNTLPINCIGDTSSPCESNSISSNPISSDNTSLDNASLYIGIGVELALIVFLGILLAVLPSSKISNKFDTE